MSCHYHRGFNLGNYEIADRGWVDNQTGEAAGENRIKNRRKAVVALVCRHCEGSRHVKLSLDPFVEAHLAWSVVKQLTPCNLSDRF